MRKSRSLCQTQGEDRTKIHSELASVANFSHEAFNYLSYVHTIMYITIIIFKIMYNFGIFWQVLNLMFSKTNELFQ